MAESNKMKFILWIGRFVHDSTSDKPSVKRFGLAITVTVLCGVLFGLGAVIAKAVVTSVGHDQVEMVRIASETFVWTATALLGTVGGSYVADKALGRKSNDTTN
jgi:hypothetical protein